MNREKVFSKIGYAYLDEMIESLSKYPGIKIQYPISDFTAGNTLFKTVTYDVNIAVATYSKYREEIELLNKEVDRLTKSIDSLNNKFCNERWLTKCPKEIILKEYDKLNYLEEERELRYKQILNRLYICPLPIFTHK